MALLGVILVGVRLQPIVDLQLCSPITCGIPMEGEPRCLGQSAATGSSSMSGLQDAAARLAETACSRRTHMH